jgi:hypothetical protein
MRSDKLPRSSVCAYADVGRRLAMTSTVPTSVHSTHVTDKPRLCPSTALGSLNSVTDRASRASEEVKPSSLRRRAAAAACSGNVSLASATVRFASRCSAYASCEP